MVIVLFGVSGAGKTTVGELLAQQLGWTFYEGDMFHPESNIEKMRNGIPLTDEDRWPWLERLRQLIGTCLRQEKSAVVACSALKVAYRRYLHVNGEVKFVFLKGDFALIEQRMRKRRGHFMPLELLQSQFTALEEPLSEVIEVDVSRGPEELVREIRGRLEI